MKLYLHPIDGITYDRPLLAPLVAPGDGGGFVLRPAIVAAGVQAVGSLAEADVAALPVLWRQHTRAERAEAVRFIDEAGLAGTRVAIWVDGDDEVDLPWPHVIQFQHAYRRARVRRTSSHAYPTFFADIVATEFDDDLAPVPKGPTPIVGFCGQARASAADEAKRLAWKVGTRAWSLAGRTEVVPEPLSSHLRLRRQVLASLEHDPRVRTDFVVRDQYRAGLDKLRDAPEVLDASSMGFFGNIRGAHYTVCVRGGGNFSVRLYETLCLGRIPLIVDDDGVLPWPDHPFWSETALVVDRRDLATLPDRVVAHHAAASEDGWIERQRAAQDFWRGWLSRPGYLHHLPELLR